MRLNVWISRIALLGLALVPVACSAPKRTIRIPESVVTNPRNKPKEQSSPMQPYVIKMSDGKRTYQIEIPVNQATGAFSTSIPLDLDRLEAETSDRPQTEADREIIEAKRAAGEKTPKIDPNHEHKTRSYLATLARVNELFKKRQYELALIELTGLDREYPDDERVLEMKGTLYFKLRRPKQAREAWERVLALNPDNATVAQALEQLSQESD